METTFVIRREELDADFLESVKRLFKDSRELHITISNAEDFGLTAAETREEYFQRLEKAAENLARGENQVVMSEAEFDEFSLN